MLACVALVSTAASIYLLAAPEEGRLPEPLPPASPPAQDPAGRTAAEAHLRQLVADAGETQAIGDVAPLSEHVPAKEPDKEWDELPRTLTTIQFPERFLFGGVSQFPIHRLFRSQDLNPHDFYIPKSDRDRLRVVIAVELKRIGELDHSLSEVGWHWLAAQIGTKSILPLRFRDTPEVREYVKANSEPGVVLLRSWLFEGGDSLDRLYAVGGVTYGVRYAAIPEAREADSLHRFMRQSLALRVGEWFVNRNCLPQAAWGLYVERVYNPRP